MPDAKELSAIDRSDSATRFARAVGDFNGDGREDEALLLRATDDRREAVWVYLTGGANEGRWFNLETFIWKDSMRGVDTLMGIETAPPGVIAYGGFCGVSGSHVRPKLRLRDPSLYVMKLPSPLWLHFWSRKYKKFLCVWTRANKPF